MKILIIEDTQANFEVAKSFFSQITEHEFIYAENFIEAMNALADIDAVITDRSMPYCSNIELPQNWSFSDRSYINGRFGTFIHIKCIELGIPVISIADHGDVMFFEYDVSKWESAVDPALAILNEDIQCCNEFHKRNDKLFQREELSSLENYCKLIDGLARGENLHQSFIIRNVATFGDISSVDVYEGLHKRDSKSWLLSWQKLQQKFE